MLYRAFLFCWCKDTVILPKTHYIGNIVILSDLFVHSYFATLSISFPVLAAKIRRFPILCKVFHLSKSGLSKYYTQFCMIVLHYHSLEPKLTPIIKKSC